MISNILGLALGVIPRQVAVLYRWTGRAINDRGLHEDMFADPVPLSGSIQPVDRARYVYLGLDAAKRYISVYSTDAVQGLARSHNPDRIGYNGRLYQVLADTDWQAPAGYTGLLATDMGPDAGADIGPGTTPGAPGGAPGPHAAY